MLPLKPEQSVAINSDCGEMVVSASAGSGKTFVMINRILRLILDKKTDIDGVLCVTFTESAAADMKSKLKKELHKAAESGETGIAEQYAKISTADICTLHGFCARLVRSYFFRAGVAPDFRIADEVESEELRSRAIDNTFRELYAEKDGGFLALAERYRRYKKDDELKAIILKMSELCDQFGEDAIICSYDRNYTAGGKERLYKVLNAALTPFLNALTGAADKARELCDNYGYGKGLEILNAYSSAIDGLKSGGAEYAKKTEDEKLPFIAGNSKFDGKDEIAPVFKELRAKIGDIKKHALNCFIEDGKAESLYESGKAFYNTVKRFKENYKKEKTDAQTLDFNDLEKYALKVLDDHDIRRAEREKYKYVFVDEYQDVNYIQEKIVSAVSCGNLFVVGDPKQSIYSFRGCRSDIFEERERNAADKGSALRLNYSFRSAKKVIEMVNAVFDYCYIKDFTGIDYRGTSELLDGEVYPKDREGRAEYHFLKKRTESAEEKPPAEIYDILKYVKRVPDKEIANISGLVAGIIEEELGKTYYDIADKKDKPVKMSDVAILIRMGANRDYGRKLVEGLAARNIRVNSDVKQNVCDFPDIGVLINALKLVDNFRQDIPLCSTMLSVVGGFTEEELTRIAVFGRENSYRSFTDSVFNFLENGDGDLREKLKTFKEYFDGVRLIADYKGAKGVLDKLTFDCDYENLMLADDDGDAKLRRYRKFIAETVKDGTSLTVRDFLVKIEKRRKAFECAEGGDEDAVKVVTMHSSKGLEYPVVIVAGLERTFFKEDEKVRIIYDGDLGFFEKYYDDTERVYTGTAYREIAKAKIMSDKITEEMRLIYVALTRAKYSLHVIAEETADTRSSGGFYCFGSKYAKYTAFFPDTLPATVHEDEKSLMDVKAVRRKVIIGKPDVAFTEKLKRDFSFRYPYAADVTLPIKNSVTAVAREKKEEYYPVNKIFGEEYAENENGATAGGEREKGIIAHRIMQFYDFKECDFGKEIARLLDSGVITREEFALLDVGGIEKAIKSDLMQEIAGKEIYREKDFIVNVPARRLFNVDSDENILIQGVIDLLAVNGQGACVIDYKYSHRSGKSLVEEYRAQLELYAYAVEKSAGIKVNKKILVNLVTGETFEIV